MIRPIFRTMLLGLVAAAGGSPALADSQSSNSSSNCSNGRCTHMESFTSRDDRGSRGWRSFEAWGERGSRSYGAPRPSRDDDDD